MIIYNYVGSYKIEYGLKYRTTESRYVAFDFRPLSYTDSSTLSS